MTTIPTARVTVVPAPRLADLPAPDPADDGPEVRLLAAEQRALKAERRHGEALAREAGLAKLADEQERTIARLRGLLGAAETELATRRRRAMLQAQGK